MKKNQFFSTVLMVSVVFLAACESAAVRHEEAFSKHPEWSETDKRLIEKGMINYGMTMEQVRAAWGRPCQTCTGTRKYESGVISWEYGTQVVFFDRDGKVTRWVTN